MAPDKKGRMVARGWLVQKLSGGDPKNYHICVPFKKREDGCHPCKQKSLWVFQTFTIAFLRVYSIICSFFFGGETRASTSTVPTTSGRRDFRD